MGMSSGWFTDVMPSSSEGVRDGTFGQCGVAAVIVEILLGVGGFNVNRSAELTVVDMNIDVQKSDNYSILLLLSHVLC